MLSGAGDAKYVLCHHERKPRLRPGFFVMGGDQLAASKRLASTFLRTFAGSQMQPFMAM